MNNLKGLSERTKAEILEMSLVEVYQKGFEDGKCFMEGVGETFEHDGVTLRRVSREAREGDYIIPLSVNSTSQLEKDKVYGPVLIDQEGNARVYSNGIRYLVYSNDHNRRPDTVEVYEVARRAGLVQAKDVIAVKKSPNQQRAELIQRAREFVEEHQRDLPGTHECRTYGNHTCRSRYYETEFHVKNNRVTAVIWRTDIYRKRLGLKPLVGRAGCAPGEVFNVDIGKAIALARALEIDVPEEFLQAVQPDYYVPGHIVTYPKQDGSEWHMAKQFRVDSVVEVDNNLTRLWEDGKSSANMRCTQYYESEDVRALPILDDTNAIYEEMSA